MVPPPEQVLSLLRNPDKARREIESLLKDDKDVAAKFTGEILSSPKLQQKIKNLQRRLERGEHTDVKVNYHRGKSDEDDIVTASANKIDGEPLKDEACFKRVLPQSIDAIDIEYNDAEEG